MVTFEWFTALRPRQTKINKRTDVVRSEDPDIDEVVLDGI
jgi:hypothetical protein